MKIQIKLTNDVSKWRPALASMTCSDPPLLYSTQQNSNHLQRKADLDTKPLSSELYGVMSDFAPLWNTITMMMPRAW